MSALPPGPKIEAIPPPPVPVGTTTIAGYSTTAVAAIMAVLAFTSGDRSESTIEGIVAGVFALVAFLSTQMGRYRQANTLAANMAKPVPMLMGSSSGGGVRLTGGSLGTGTPPRAGTDR